MEIFKVVHFWDNQMSCDRNNVPFLHIWHSLLKSYYEHLILWNLCPLGPIHFESNAKQPGTWHRTCSQSSEDGYVHDSQIGNMFTLLFFRVTRKCSDTWTVVLADKSFLISQQVIGSNATVHTGAVVKPRNPCIYTVRNTMHIRTEVY